MSKEASNKDQAFGVQARSSALPSRLSRLVREAGWLLLAALAAYSLLIFMTYSTQDPGWSRLGADPGIQNAGGRMGAWIADLFFYLFGASAWLWVLLMLTRLWSVYRRLMPRSTAEEPALPRVRWERGLGFTLLLLSTTGMETLRLHTHGLDLPNGPGGVLGSLVAASSAHLLGFTGSTLLLLVLIAVGLSLWLGFSWLVVCERVGTAAEVLAQRLWFAWQARRDRKLGQQALAARAEVVETRAEQATAHEPLRIEPALVAIPKSSRVREEQQPALFTELAEHQLPAIGLLDPAPAAFEQQSPETLEFNSRLIEKKLGDFGVQVTVVAAQPGPVITRYEIEPATGVKGSQVVNLSKDLARSLSLVSIRVVETIPGKNYMGLELPNPRRQAVRLSEILGSETYHKSSSLLTLALGKDIAGKPVVADLAKMPHLLVAGTTGSGKSVGINAMILSLLYKAEATQTRLILIDPKMLEMSVYEGIPHLLAPVVTDMRQAANALNWCVNEMDRRYKLLSKLGVRNLAGYNQRIADAVAREEPIPNPFSLTPDAPEPLTPLPHIVVVIDELADLMMVVGKKIEELIARLAQKARAAGIHLILATQRPSVDVITGLIKANVPTRIAFQVSSKIDSRTILDQMGAETLLGQGDMLFLAPGTGVPTRVHGAFVSDEEVHRVVEYLKAQGPADYIEGILEGAGEGETGDGLSSVTGFGGGDAEADPMYDQAVEVVLKHRKASISLVQRHLRIGYNRAARLLEAMEQAGLVSAMQSNGNRSIIAPNRDGGEA